MSYMALIKVIRTMFGQVNITKLINHGIILSSMIIKILQINLSLSSLILWELFQFYLVVKIVEMVLIKGKSNPIITTGGDSGSFMAAFTLKNQLIIFGIKCIYSIGLVHMESI